MTDDIVTRLRNYESKVLAAPPYYRELIRIAADEIERLRAERDEARRGLCYEVAAWVAGFKHSTHEAESRAEAERRGWDCYKEATDGK